MAETVKYLIIKSSLSKLKRGGLKSNLGDLLRSTVLLNFFKDNVYWLSDKRSIPILKWFMPAKRLLTFEDNLKQCIFSKNSSIYNVDNYVFDESVFRTRLKGKWYGYIWAGNGDVHPANELMANTEPYASHVKNRISWQESLIRGMGFQWSEQDYPFFVLRHDETVDVGLNWRVHTAWGSKKWPLIRWRELNRILSRSNSVSWQEDTEDMESYLKWVSSCKVIITCDTFGLHLASALRKKVVAIVGPTQSREFSYGRVSFIEPPQRDCMPCNQPKCAMKMHCLNDISAESVGKEVLRILN